jgi:pilus assembly protein CpaB
MEASPTALVLVANEELPAGQFIKEKNLRWQQWPKDGVSDSYYIKDESKRKDRGDQSKPAARSATNSKRDEPGKAIISDFVGAVVRSRVMPGEPITDGRIVRPGDRGFLAAVLQPGTRAISVPINATTGISGFVFPGDKVDMLLTHTIRGGIDKEDIRRATETVLSDIRVLAVDQRTDDVDGKAEVAKTATLEVSPKQAEVIAVASEMGRLSLSLRSLAKKDQSLTSLRKSRTYTWDTEASHLIPRKGNNKNSHVVKVFRGGTATDRQFAKNSVGGYGRTTGANIQPAAKQAALAPLNAPKNLIGKVNK